MDSEQENEKVHSQAVDVGRTGKLSWILTVCVATPEVPDHQRNWVKRMLTVVGEIADFPILQELAKVCSAQASRYNSKLETTFVC